MHYFVVHAYSRGKRAGAYVCCWINFRLYEGALLLAKFYIRKAGWTVRSLDSQSWFDDVSEVARDDRRYFREAQKDGASFVFHRYDKRRAKPGRRQIET